MIVRPNFLIFITDQFHPRCLGYAGHPVVRTPNIDRLARSGTIFSRMYTNQPLCMPARATMFTGLTPRGHRVRMNGIALDPSIPTFTEALRAAGYRTHCCGKIHLNCSITPNGISSDTLDPVKFPEAAVMWKSGRLTSLPLPYYGIESVDFVGGHGNGSFGEYVSWLKREHPAEARLFLESVPLETPTEAMALFNRASMKWALPAALHPMSWITDRTIDFLNRTARSRAEGNADPFCLMCSIQEPHSPFAPPKEYAYRFHPSEVPPPVGREDELDELPPHFRRMIEEGIITSGNKNEAMNRTAPYYAECAAHYYSLIEMLDDQVGRVMEALKTNDLEKDTVVIFVADHGEALGDHGLWGKGPYHIDGVIRVPFLVAWPGHFQAHAVHDGVTSLLDFAPTILDAAGVPIPEGPAPAIPEAPAAPATWPGRSLVPILTGAATPDDVACVVEMDEDYLGFKMRTLVTRRYRLTCYSGQDYGELFDLQEDPGELFNLWDLPGRRALRDELRLRLLDQIMATDISVPRQMSRS